MSFSIRDLFYTILLVLNGLAILNEERFLARIGWSTSQVSFSGNESVKAKLLSLISAVRTLLRRKYLSYFSSLLTISSSYPEF
ncbi:hypothetical protein DSO57_1030241 [Entomophthora muscae]|uniref:Uncharacterized protein n=1 Tax=Entomophthora muscae TaxID=34485 RepID=A0ACC2SQT5_9FUNG|nr:hypothetical protein DSO57_1030241 [Entomophthora muscae]